METLIVVISVIFLWLVFGSFGSVIFYRLWEWPTKKVWKWFLIWRSECPKCHHNLKARNLVPLFSFLFQWWKCEYCKAPISWFYPFLEFTTVCIFGIIAFINLKYWIPFHQNLWLQSGIGCTICMAISAWLLWLILLYDIKTYELHITATVFLAVISLFSTLFFGSNKLEILLWAWLFAVIFLLIYFFTKWYVKIKYKKNSEWFWLWDVIVAPILWARLAFFIQPRWEFERYYLISFFLILSCVAGLLHYWIEILIKHLLKNKAKKQNDKIKETDIPFEWAPIIPFLPSMIVWFIVEICLRDFVVENCLQNILVNLM